MIRLKLQMGMSCLTKATVKLHKQNRWTFSFAFVNRQGTDALLNSEFLRDSTANDMLETFKVD